MSQVSIPIKISKSKRLVSTRYEPPYYHVSVRIYSNEIFPNRWIIRHVEYWMPTRSSVLYSLNLFIWGYLKVKMFVTRPTNIDDFEERIFIKCIITINEEMRNNVLNSFQNRIWLSVRLRSAFRTLSTC